MEDEDMQLHDELMRPLKSCMEIVVIEDLHGGRRRGEGWGGYGLDALFKVAHGSM